MQIRKQKIKDKIYYSIGFSYRVSGDKNPKFKVLESCGDEKKILAEHP
jgi:hypothetical protein